MLQTFFEMGKNATLEREQEVIEPTIAGLMHKWHLESTPPGEIVGNNNPQDTSTTEEGVVIDGMETLNILASEKLGSIDLQTPTE